MNRKERRAEERRIIAEMDSAMQAKKEEKPKTVDFASGEQTKVYGKEAPEILHCRRCRSVMEKGVCPECGYKIFGVRPVFCIFKSQVLNFALTRVHYF